MQFMLEELNANEEDITVVIDRKDIVGWLKNIEDTNWQLRFLRNKVKNVANLFMHCSVVFKQNGIKMIELTWIHWTAITPSFIDPAMMICDKISRWLGLSLRY
ncbi:hypothetical protein PIB30_043546 [Stylosanthes scabra]|uniref:Uncharacterized protein n=1 Tax=Stylosanthes scabra TaxID=79078 RepID=A0ABU6WDW5_9FABA|nr:hypothetical protein [Stylosanthes scabra]